MINNKKTVCVFASSSNDVEEIFCKEAQDLGRLIGENEYNLVYGGSRRGLMYICANSAKNHGSEICGIMPEKLANFGLANPEDCDEFYITSGMRERKAKMDELSEAVVAIAGGYGTLEEISELIVQKQLGYNNKPIVILNTAGFYNDLLKFFDSLIDKNFANEASKELYYVAQNSTDAINYIKNYQIKEIGLKFIK